MFSKLRNKILILGMVVTSLVLITAFTVTYMITQEGIQLENTEKLRESATAPFIPSFPNVTGEANIAGNLTESLMQLMIPSDYKPSFTLLLDESGSLIGKYSYIDMPEEAYAEAAQKAWRNRESDTPIRVSGRLWQYASYSKGYYMITTSTRTSSSDEGAQVSVVTDDMEVYQFTFLDVTESHQTLRKLLITFLIVGVVTLAVVFATSLIFANNAIKPIQSAWEAQRQFMADASHELKTPITIINSNYGALVSRRGETIDSQMKWLNYIKEGADRMDKLIGELLYLARTESITDGVGTGPVNVSEVVRSEVHAMETAARAKDLCVAQEIQPEMIIESDGEKLAQVIRILLDNAIRYANEGGSVDVSARSEKHHLVITVKNTGCGIAKEHLPKIFDRFYRADASRTHDGGYGLGLSIAKAILDGLGGKIHAESDEGIGATFTVVL